MKLMAVVEFIDELENSEGNKCQFSDFSVCTDLCEQINALLPIARFAFLNDLDFLIKVNKWVHICNI